MMKGCPNSQIDLCGHRQVVNDLYVHIHQAWIGRFTAKVVFIKTLKLKFMSCDLYPLHLGDFLLCF